MVSSITLIIMGVDRRCFCSLRKKGLICTSRGFGFPPEISQRTSANVAWLGWISLPGNKNLFHAQRRPMILSGGID
jgi:hypothetical protein